MYKYICKKKSWYLLIKYLSDGFAFHVQPLHWTLLVYLLFTFIMCGCYFSVFLVQIIQIPVFVCIDHICEISGFCCNRVPTIQTLSCPIIALCRCMTLV